MVVSVNLACEQAGSDPKIRFHFLNTRSTARVSTIASIASNYSLHGNRRKRRGREKIPNFIFHVYVIRCFLPFFLVVLLF